MADEHWNSYSSGGSQHGYKARAIMRVYKRPLREEKTKLRKTKESETELLLVNKNRRLLSNLDQLFPIPNILPADDQVTYQARCDPSAC